MSAIQIIHVHRRDLYKQLWTSPVRHGYWAKLKHGHTARKTPLLPAPEGTPDVHAFRVATEASRAITGIAAGKPSISPLEIDLEIRVSEDDLLRHKATRAARKAAAATSLDQYGRVVLAGNGLPNIAVSPESLDRALRIFDALIHGASQAGFEFVFGDECKAAAHFMVEEERIDIRVDEQLRRERRKLRKSDFMGRTHDLQYFPTSQLRLSIEAPDVGLHKRRWRDTDTIRVENSLVAVVHRIHEAAQRIKSDRERRELQARHWDLQRQLEDAKARLVALEKEHRKELVEQAWAWREAQTVRRFIAAVRTTVGGAVAEPTERTLLEEWLQWASSQADIIDPLNETSGYDLRAAFRMRK
jgi:hypothetical protein